MTDPKPFVWTATVESIEAEAIRLSSDAGADQTGVHSAENAEEDQISKLFSRTPHYGMRTLGYSLVLPRNAYSTWAGMRTAR